MAKVETHSLAVITVMEWLIDLAIAVLSMLDTYAPSSQFPGPNKYIITPIAPANVSKSANFHD